MNTPSSRSRSGFAPAIYIAYLAAVALLAWAIKPSLLPGASHRAAASTQATARLDAATTSQGAAAAASIAKIGEVIAGTPASPARDFIAQEIPMALSLLPAPDPVKLLEAERRRSAVMEGRLDEARRLYEQGAHQAAQLQHERDEALAARRAADLALEQAAAAAHARTLLLAGLTVLALLLGGAYLWLHDHSIGHDALGVIAAKIRAGIPAIDAIDDHLTPRAKVAVNRFARLATPTDAPAAPRPAA